MSIKSTDDTLISRQLFRIQNEIEVLRTNSRVIDKALEEHRGLTRNEILTMLNPARYIHISLAMHDNRLKNEENKEGRV